MRVSKGGTDMHCPSCNDTRTCRAIPAPQVTFDANDYGQRQYYSEHDDIHFFQRGRECLTCYETFLTAEVDLVFLEELVELRNALKSIKSNAERYVKESAAASKSLGKLGDSLGVLRALKIYKQANE